MTDDLAEILLAEVMGWGADEVSSERPYLQALAYYKYDEYQQFTPGMRFVESLALWLQQFTTKEERTTAYQFVKERMLFVSSAEMQHLVSTIYRDLIRTILFNRVAQDVDAREYKLRRVSESIEFK